MRARSMQPSSVHRRAGESRCKIIVRERSGGLCEVDGKPAREMAHRIARSQGGTWRASDILHLCKGCHDAQRDNKGGGLLARKLGQTLERLEYGIPTDTERAPVQCRYGRVYLLDDGTIVEAS